jgi:hypothetical protein
VLKVCLKWRGPEGDAFRDYVQRKLLEAELKLSEKEVELAEAKEHAESLIPKKTPAEEAKIVAKKLEEKASGEKAQQGEPESVGGVSPTQMTLQTPERTQRTAPSETAAKLDRAALAAELVDSIDPDQVVTHNVADFKTLGKNSVDLVMNDKQKALRVLAGTEEAPPRYIPTNDPRSYEQKSNSRAGYSYNSEVEELHSCDSRL